MLNVSPPIGIKARKIVKIGYEKGQKDREYARSYDPELVEEFVEAPPEVQKKARPMFEKLAGETKEQATTVTNYYLGKFKEDLSYQNRYLRFISK